MLKLSEAAIDQLLATQPQFSGVVMVAQQGQVHYTRCVGMANRSEQIANSVHSRFGIASGTKTFTAVAIGQLVAQGVLDYNQSLQSCVGVALPTFDPAVTLHQLLCHTAGIPDYFDEAVLSDYAALWNDLPMYRLRRPADFLPLIQQKPMMFPPGERFHYNNAGFVLLGLVIEQATGRSLPEYITTEVFQVAGMLDSGYFATDQLPARTALGYIDDETGWRTNTFAIPIIGGGDGGAYVTAPDLLRFWQSLLNETLLPKAQFEAMFTLHATEDEAHAYGYGIWLSGFQDGYKYRMVGGDPGVSFTSTCYPTVDLQIIALSNVSRGAGTICRGIEQLLEAAGLIG